MTQRRVAMPRSKTCPAKGDAAKNYFWQFTPPCGHYAKAELLALSRMTFGSPTHLAFHGVASCASIMPH